MEKDGLYMLKDNRLVDIQFGIAHNFIWFNKNSKYNIIRSSVLKFVLKDSTFIGRL